MNPSWRLAKLAHQKTENIAKIWNHIVDALLRFFQKSSVEGKRQDALRPLRNLSVIVGSLFFACVCVDAPLWILKSLFWMFAGSIAINVITYFYFVWCLPDFVRSEDFGLSKFAIHEVSLGDSNIGILDLTDLIRLERRSGQQHKSDDSQ